MSEFSGSIIRSSSEEFWGVTFENSPKEVIFFSVQLMYYLCEHHLLCPQQYGFRLGLSTEAALLDAVTYTVNNIDRGLVTSLVTAETRDAPDKLSGRIVDFSTIRYSAG